MNYVCMTGGILSDLRQLSWLFLMISLFHFHLFFGISPELQEWRDEGNMMRISWHHRLSFIIVSCRSLVEGRASDQVEVTRHKKEMENLFSTLLRLLSRYNNLSMTNDFFCDWFSLMSHNYMLFSLFSRKSVPRKKKVYNVETWAESSSSNQQPQLSYHRDCLKMCWDDERRLKSQVEMRNIFITSFTACKLAFGLFLTCSIEEQLLVIRYASLVD